MASRKNSKQIGLKLAALSIAALAVTSLSFTIGLCSGAGFAPAMAEGMEEGQGAQVGAKGLFFQQLEKPTENINTGLRYWIEMKRNGVTQRVSNKTQFRSGDSIRFHVRSNIDGYAYILLSNGSRGEHEVLFPDEKAGEKNRVGAGRDYVLPQDGALTFDENPGLEKLTLLLSRTPIDAQAYLAKPAGEKELTLIASASDGAKDLVPARIYVAYSAPHSDGPPPILLAAANKHSQENKQDKSEKTDKTDKTDKVVKTPKKVAKTEPKHTAPATTDTASATKTPSAPAKHPITKNATAVAYNAPHNARDDEGTTTVVSEKASGVLHVDVDLEHI
jgi:hypothetical protein